MNTVPNKAEFCTPEKITQPRNEKSEQLTNSLEKSSAAEQLPANVKAEGLLKPSKKITKTKSIENRSVSKFTKFFQKWSELKRYDRNFKQQTRFWWSGFSSTGYKTSIYRVFFNSIRIHFVLSIDESSFSFEKIKEEDWGKLFLNLIEYMREQVYDLGPTFEPDRRFQAVYILIRGLDSFKAKKITHV